MAKFFNKHSEVENLDGLSIPKHVAIIMDGNGRWAKKRLLSRSMGHKAGGETLRKIVYAAADLGIQFLTVYAFSTENWKRSEEEIHNIMNIFLEFFEKYNDEFKKIDCRVRFMGRKDKIPEKVWQTIQKIEEHTQTGKTIQLNVAFNYGGRQEIVDAVNKFLAQENVHSKEITIQDINEHLYLPDVPEPDLIIRSSGELRTSNFLLWEAAYSEYYISDVLWPDFTKKDLIEAIVQFNTRDRRFGGVQNG